MRSIIAVSVVLSLVIACAAKTAGQEPAEEASLGGRGEALGGCPVDEPGRGTACSIPGRMCAWTRACADAGDATTNDTGWCASDGRWQISAGRCQAGCPATPTRSMPGQFGPPPNDRCTVGLACVYPSTPEGGGLKCTCSAASDGRTVWPSVCDAFDDGWKPAPTTTTIGKCEELAPCGGSSGCATTCPAAAPKSCSCAPDGRLVCKIGKAC